VFTHERMDFAGIEVEVDPVNGEHRAEALANPAQREHRLAHNVTGLKVASCSRVDGGKILPAIIALRRTSSSLNCAGVSALRVYLKSVSPMAPSLSPSSICPCGTLPVAASFDIVKTPMSTRF